MTTTASLTRTNGTLLSDLLDGRLNPSGKRHSDGAPPPAANAPATAVNPLRAAATAALADACALRLAKEQALRDDPQEYASKLPEALQGFRPLAKETNITAAAKGLHELELAVAREPLSAPAVAALRGALQMLPDATKAAITERTLDEALLDDLVVECQAVIDAGNRDFLTVYAGVWSVTVSGEADNLKSYDVAVAELRRLCSNEAVQRAEAADAATLFSDAARAKPAFDVVVKAVSEASGGGRCRRRAVRWACGSPGAVLGQH